MCASKWRRTLCLHCSSVRHVNTWEKIMSLRSGALAHNTMGGTCRGTNLQNQRHTLPISLNKHCTRVPHMCDPHLAVLNDCDHSCAPANGQRRAPVAACLQEALLLTYGRDISAPIIVIPSVQVVSVRLLESIRCTASSALLAAEQSHIN